MKKLIVFFAFMVVTLTSCSKDDDGNSNSSSPYLQSVTLINGNNAPINLTFDYNDQKKLKSITDADNDVLYLTYEDNKIAAITGNGTSSEFTYSGNALASINVNGQITNVQYNSSQNKYTFPGSGFEYTLDEYGDLIIAHSTGANGDTSVLTYENDKKGAFYNYSPLDNFIISVFTGTAPTLSAKPILTYDGQVMANTYDNGGRLTKAVATTNGQVTSTVTYTYTNL